MWSSLGLLPSPLASDGRGCCGRTAAYPSVRAVTYIGLEDQGRFDPISLQWQGTSDTDLNDPGEFVEVVNDTKARVCLPDNPTAFKVTISSHPPSPPPPPPPPPHNPFLRGGVWLSGC